MSPASSAPLPEDSWRYQNEYAQRSNAAISPNTSFVSSHQDNGSLLGDFEGSTFDMLNSGRQLSTSPQTGPYAWPGSSPPYGSAALGSSLSPRSSGSTIPAHFRQPSHSHLSTGTHLRSLSSLHRDLPPRPAPSVHAQDPARQPQQQQAASAGDAWGNPFAGMDHMDSAPRPLPVDQVAEEVVDAWFAEADSTHLGLVSGSDAVKFFSRSGLSQPDLSRVSFCWYPVRSSQAKQTIMTSSAGPPARSSGL